MILYYSIKEGIFYLKDKVFNIKFDHIFDEGKYGYFQNKDNIIGYRIQIKNNLQKIKRKK